MSVRPGSTVARGARKMLVLCVAIAASVGTAEAQIRALAGGGTILAKDANLFVQQEATAEVLAIFGRVFGDDPMRAMPWTGTVSDLGWTYSLASPYRDGNLTLDYSGTYDAVTNVISWNGTLNFIGSTSPLRSRVSIASHGTFTDATIDGFWDAVLDATIDALEIAEEGVTIVHRTATVAAIAGFEVISAEESAPVGGPEVVLVASEKLNEYDIEFVEQNSSSFHEDAGGNFEDREFLRPVSGRLPDRPSPPLPPPYLGPLAVTSSGRFTTPFTNPIVSNAGTVTIAAVPEPETVALFASGFILIGAMCRLRRSDRV